MGQRPESGPQPTWSTPDAARVFRTYYYGPRNATPNGVISRRFGFTDQGTNGRHGIKSSRSVTKLVDRLQRAGYPIARNQDGYFWATAPAQFDFVMHDLDSRIATWSRMRESAQMAMRYFSRGLFERDEEASS